MNKFEARMTTHRVGTEGLGSVENFRARRRAFRALHEAGCFVIPNPWDVGSARYLQQLGFPALATTSAGFAFSQGMPDSEGALTCERNLVYIADIAEAVDVPARADLVGLAAPRPEAQSRPYEAQIFGAGVRRNCVESLGRDSGGI